MKEHTLDLPHDSLTVRYIPLSQATLWNRNPKRHDIGAIVTSIAEHGFRDPPAYDSQLEAFVEGNGRTEALLWMFRQEYTVPRGIGQVLGDGGAVVDWAMPVLFGVDALSRIAAERYGIDHNNLVLSGGDFTAVDYARMWDHSYVDVLRDMAEQNALPVSVNGADVEQLLRLAGEGGGSLQLDYDSGASGGLAEGPQFELTDFVATIGLSHAQANTPELKTDLAAFCDRWGLKVKIAKRQ